MIAERCARERELLDALGRGFLDSAILEHADECAACNELRVVAGALLDDRAHAMAGAPVPSASTMWWRIQLRQKREAEAAARRSLLIGQAATLVFALGLLGALLGTEIAVSIREVMAAIRLSTPLLLALSAWLVFLPIAGWVAIRQK
jgi:hypothetical protein